MSEHPLTKNIRYNSVSGLYETESTTGKIVTHFSEWWNGEGLDFTITGDAEDKSIGLHIEEMHHIAVIANALGFIDLDEVKRDSDELNDMSKKREMYIKGLKDEPKF